MAVYASSVTIYGGQGGRAERVGRTLGLMYGSLDITNYNSTQTAETDITRYFSSSATQKPYVIFDGISDNGYSFQWIPSTAKVKVWMSDLSTSTDGPLVELSSDVDAGACNFIVVGLRKP